ncbi:MAG: hypothetical protein WKG00_12985 [Polyangiaceae bacterium]
MPRGSPSGNQDSQVIGSPSKGLVLVRVSGTMRGTIHSGKSASSSASVAANSVACIQCS